ncbi:MAG: hypothetical protein JW768_00985 [Chitinispirillaceae bacterium]|nr:hypothetical protein [Chitinispirillaceae bacterium]
MTDCCSNPVAEKASCCCATMQSPPYHPATSLWTGADRRAAVLCRLFDRFRMRYRVDPGLYTLGTPDPASPVFVSANYGLSFNLLRRALGSIDGWILVLDTNGINVWCAAGKGTFGTSALVRQIKAVNLASHLSHREIIVPQLGAAGISAHDVKKATGFVVRYGPVRANDVPAYLDNNRTATPVMRTVTFSLTERAILTPLELVPALKKFVWIILGTFLIMGLFPDGILLSPGLDHAVPVIGALFAAVFSGTVLTPILLPFIPFRAFSVKGAIMGAITLVPFALAYKTIFLNSILLTSAVALVGCAISSYLALNFTGSTTYTSMSGVKKEMRVALPVYGALCVVATALVVLFKLYEWGIL